MKTLNINKNFPVWLMSPPYNIDTRIKNNIWMLENNKEPINFERAFYQWLKLYRILSHVGLVLTLPAKPGLQDQTFVNSIKFIPTENVAIASNFTAEGRAGEEVIAKNYLETFNIIVYYPSHKFESPDLKFIPRGDSIKDGIYIGGYGKRTDKMFFKWLKLKFQSINDNNLITINIGANELSDYLYHLDCYLFPVFKDNVVLCTELFEKKEIKQIEKYVNIIDVDADLALQGITNSIRAEFFVINATMINQLSKNDELYELEKRKNETLEKIASKLGLEVIFLDLSEFLKSGALASCFVERLSWADYY